MNQSSGSIEDLLGRMWRDYIDLNPQAKRIADLFAARGEQVVNDHIALRTFGVPHLGISVLASAFIRSGYEPKGSYEFPEKKLVAKHFEAPGRPKVFISELQVERLDRDAQSIISRLVQSMELSLLTRFDLCVTGASLGTCFR